MVSFSGNAIDSNPQFLHLYVGGSPCDASIVVGFNSIFVDLHFGQYFCFMIT